MRQIRNKRRKIFFITTILTWCQAARFKPTISESVVECSTTVLLPLNRSCQMLKLIKLTNSIKYLNLQKWNKEGNQNNKDIFISIIFSLCQAGAGFKPMISQSVVEYSTTVLRLISHHCQILNLIKLRDLIKNIHFLIL